MINGRSAVLKKDFSFEYICENRLFMGRDGYTLNIVFSLKDCPENIAIFGHINRMDVAKGYRQLRMCDPRRGGLVVRDSLGSQDIGG